MARPAHKVRLRGRSLSLAAAAPLSLAVPIPYWEQPLGLIGTAAHRNGGPFAGPVLWARFHGVAVERPP